MPKVKVNDIHLYYERNGQGEPLIFITGFNADHHVWDGITRNFTKNYDVLAIDNRGSGRSDVPDLPYTIEMMADDIIGLCDVLGLQTCHFVGLSMGSAITMTIAYKYSDRCKSIVLTNGFRKIDVRFETFIRTRLDLSKYNVPANIIGNLSIAWSFSPGFLNQPGIYEYLIQSSKDKDFSMTEVGVRNQFHALQHFNALSWLDKIKVSALVIGSDSDLIVPEEDMRAIAASIPNAEYYSFQGVGHCPQVEKPGDYSQIVLDFIAKHSG